MRIVYIFMVGRLTCYCIYLSYLELIAKSLRQKYAPGHSSPDSRLTLCGAMSLPDGLKTIKRN